MAQIQTKAEREALLEIFSAVPLPDYVAPGARPAMGQHNDRLYQMQQSILQARLDELAGTRGLAEALRALYAQQVDIGFIQDDFSQVSYFRYRANGDDERFLIVQFNPKRAERFKGAGRKKPPAGAQAASVTDLSCFLCVENIRWQHRGVQSYYRFDVNGRPHHALCNPFPFMPAHLTIAAGDHIAQAFHLTGDPAASQAKTRRIVEDLYGIAEQLPSFVGFYNGVGAGASIEKHLHFHFFELPDGHGIFPIQRAAQLTAAQAQPDHVDRAAVLRLRGYPLTAFRVRGEKEAVIEQVAGLTLRWDEQMGEAASANISVLWEEGQISMYFVPRNKFFTRSPGLAGMVAGLETLGEFIFCTDEEQRAINEQRVNYDYLARILEAVRPQENAA